MEHAARALLGEAIRDYCAQPEQRAKLEGCGEAGRGQGAGHAAGRHR